MRPFIYVDRDGRRRPLETPLGESVRIAVHYDGGALEFHADANGVWSVMAGPSRNGAGEYRTIASGRLLQFREG